MLFFAVAICCSGFFFLGGAWFAVGLRSPVRRWASATLQWRLWGQTRNADPCLRSLDLPRRMTTAAAPPIPLAREDTITVDGKIFLVLSKTSRAVCAFLTGKSMRGAEMPCLGCFNLFSDARDAKVQAHFQKARAKYAPNQSAADSVADDSEEEDAKTEEDEGLDAAQKQRIGRKQIAKANKNARAAKKRASEAKRRRRKMEAAALQSLPSSAVVTVKHAALETPLQARIVLGKGSAAPAVEWRTENIQALFQMAQLDREAGIRAQPRRRNQDERLKKSGFYWLGGVGRWVGKKPRGQRRGKKVHQTRRLRPNQHPVELHAEVCQLAGGSAAASASASASDSVTASAPPPLIPDPAPSLGLRQSLLDVFFGMPRPRKAARRAAVGAA